MSRRRRTRGDAATYPALTQFARAYLHEDFIAEYGDVIAAVRAFGADATTPERRALSAELTRLVMASSDWPETKLATFVNGTIGAVWATASPSALREMAAALDAM